MCCTNQLALLTTDTVQKGSWTRTVYVVADIKEGGQKQLTLVEGLQFHLYIGVPRELDPHLLYEEMVLSYANACYGRGAKDVAKREVASRRQELASYQQILKELQQQQCCVGVDNNNKEDTNIGDEQNQTKRAEYIKLRERQEDRVAGKKLELQVAEAKLVTLRNKGYLLEQYHKLLHCVDPVDDEPLMPPLPPGPSKLAWIQRQMAGWQGFCCVTDYRPYDIAEQASLRRSKLNNHTTYRFSFDNHMAVPYFVRKFSNPFEVGAFDEDGRRITGAPTYQIWVLQDGSRDPSLFTANKSDPGMVQHLLQQTLAFTQKDYVYKWYWPRNKVFELKYGCLEPPFPTKTTGLSHVLLDSQSKQHGGDILAYMNKHCASVRYNNTGGETGSTAKMRYMAHCTVTFSLAELFGRGCISGDTAKPHSDIVINLVNVRDKQVAMSLHIESIASESKKNKKRSANEASLSEHAGHDVMDRNETTTTKPDISKKGALSLLVGHNPNKPVAAAKLTNLPGQKKVQQQGSLLLFASKRCKEG